jgi:hypothetical protein
MNRPSAEMLLILRPTKETDTMPAFTGSNFKALLSVLGATALGLAVPDAAYACQATIGDFVWMDSNRNGAQDPGEEGIAGVLVELWSLDGQLLLSTYTDGSGRYSFVGGRTEPPPVCETQYVVKVTAPAGLTAAQIDAGGDDALDSDDPAGALATPVDPDYDGHAYDLTVDFGFAPTTVCTASIGDFVWNDLNKNGIQEADEPGIATFVTLTEGSSTVGRVDTNESGLYAFTELTCGKTYTVCAGTPPDFQASPLNAGDNDGLDSDGTPPSAGNSNCADVEVGSGGGTNFTVDFGFWKTPTTSPGTGTPGYWKTHPEAWPVDLIEIGGASYAKDQALYWMGLPDGDKTITMFRSLVSAKLNVLIGNDASCIASTIAAGDAWMASYGPVGSGVKGRSAAWKAGEAIYWELDAYNNGDRCAPHRQ